MNELVGPVAEDLLSMLGVPLGGTLSSFGRLVIAERERCTSVALGAAESMTGLQREELQDWISAKPEVVPIVIRVLHAAGNSGNDRTLRALGQALGRVYQEPAQRGRQELIVMALEGLTEEHLEVLAVSTQDRQTPELIAEQLAGRVEPELVPMALTSMMPRGLYSNPYGGYGGGENWALSTLGLAVRDAAIAAYPQRTDD